jgi:ATP-binding cassette subfamily C protein
LAVLGLALLLLSPLVAVASMLYFLLVAVVLHRVVSTWATHVGRTVTRAEAESTETLQEALRGIRELRVSHRMGTYQQRFRRLRLVSSSVQGDLAFLTVVPKYVFEIALVLGALLLAGLEFAVEPGPAAVATIATFLIAGTRIVPSLLRTQGALILIKSATVPANEVVSLSERLHLDSPDCQSAAIATSHPPDSRIEVRDVFFTYSGSLRPVLRDVDLTVPDRTMLAVVGPSGGGKSTLLDMLSGLLVPDSGSVTIGGLRPQEVARRWPGFLMYVPQSPLVSNGSILANVALGIEEGSVDVDRVHEALAMVHLQDVVEEHGGIRAPVGELGSRLSGGQRQRLGLARALYGDPRIVLLDEATSALDAESEAVVTSMLEELSTRVTVVVVAHRLATLRRSQLIAYIDGGNVTVASSFNDLRQSVERFDLQASLSGL